MTNRIELIEIRTEQFCACDTAPRMHPLRNRAYKNPESAESREARAREPVVVTVLPAFGENRVFATVAAFFKEWRHYKKMNYSKSTSRDSQTQSTYNRCGMFALCPHGVETDKCTVLMFRKREEKHLAAGGVIDAAFLAGQIPAEMKMHHLTRRCHRGYRRMPRPSTDLNKQKRTVKNSLYTKCRARITVTIRQHTDGSWDFVTSNEVSWNSQCVE
jgi:hypothetical protein